MSKTFEDIIRSDKLYSNVNESIEKLRDEQSGHIPPAVNALVVEKADRDRKTVQEGLRVLENYVTKGNTDYLPYLTFLIEKIKEK